MRTLARSVALGLLLAACSAAPALTPSPSPTGIAANATPPPGFVAFTSSVAPYTACYPQDWQVRTDWTGLGTIKGDAFVGGEPGDLPDAVTILAEPAEGHDTARYVEEVLANLRARGLGTEVLGKLPVNGANAQLLRFARLTSDGQRYTVHEAVWAQRGYGWIVVISVAPANADRALGTLRVMLGCFRMR